MDSLSRIVRLQGLKYSWKRGTDFSSMDNSSPGSRLGFIAQHVAEQFPELVEETSNGYLTVAYSHFAPPIIEALKHHMRKMSQLQDSQAELQQLSERYHKLVSEIRSDPVDSGPKTDHKAPRADLTSKSKRNRQSTPIFRRTFTGFATSTRIMVFVIPVLMLAVIVLGLALGISSMHRSPEPAPPTAPPPVRIINYLSDGGFEDPQSPLWSGNFSIASYETSLWPPGALMKSLAPFDAQDRFLLLNSTSPGKSAFASHLLAGIPSYTFNITVWCYLAANTSSDAVIGLSVGFSPLLTPSTIFLNQGSCFSSTFADLQRVGSWQFLQVFSTCASLDPRDRLVVTLSAVGAEAIVAFDSITLEPVDGWAPFRHHEFGLAGTSQVSIPDFAGSKFLAFTSFLDPNGAYYVGIVELDSLRIGAVRYLASNLDLSLGIDGILWTDLILMEYEITAQSIEADSLGRVVVTGAASLAFGAPAAAVSRFNYDGSRDLTFGTRGTVYLAVQDQQPSRVVCTGLYMLFDENIVTLWHISYDNGTSASFIARLLPSGALDPSFGTAGLVLMPPELSKSVALSEDDQYLLIAAVSSNKVQVAQLSVNGVINTTWSVDAIPSTVTLNAGIITRLKLMISPVRLSSNLHDVHSFILFFKSHFVILPRFPATSSLLH
jgi:hypothetical protein